MADELPTPEAEQQTFFIHRVPLQFANLEVHKDDENGTTILKLGPLVFEFSLTFTPEQARQLGRALTSGIEIASGIPRGVVKI